MVAGVTWKRFVLTQGRRGETFCFDEGMAWRGNILTPGVVWRGNVLTSGVA